MQRELIINGQRINDEADCYVVAEIGHNHQGDVDTAKKLISAAKECGADAVKFQKRNNKLLFTHTLLNQIYDNPNSYGRTYGEHREFLEFGEAEYKELIEYAKEVDITMFATPFDFESVDFLAELNMPAYKIASGDLRNIPLIEHIARMGKPIILSTGGGTEQDVLQAYYAIRPLNDQLAILQCTAAYPCEFDKMDLRVIETYRKMFPCCVVGLSAHDNGIAMALVAYVLGARIIEKHFTLNRAWKGTDHAFSLEPIGLRKMVRDLRRARVALGSNTKRFFDCEIGPLYKMSKMIVAKHDLPEGHIIKPDDITFKSPCAGLEPLKIKEVIGRSLALKVNRDEGLKLEYFK